MGEIATTGHQPKLGLYELTSEMVELDRLLEEGGGDLDVVKGGRTLEEWMNQVQPLQQAKVDNYGDYFATLKALEKSLGEEIENMERRRSATKAKQKILKDLAERAMVAHRIVKIEGLRHTISYVKNGGKPRLELLVDEAKVPKEYVMQVPKIDLETLRVDLELGKPEAKTIAELVGTGYGVRIK